MDAGSQKSPNPDGRSRMLRILQMMQFDKKLKQSFDFNNVLKEVLSHQAFKRFMILFAFQE